jgi:hypothetical protein
MTTQEKETLEIEDNTPVIDFNDLPHNGAQEIYSVTEVVTIGDLTEYDWVFDENMLPQPIKQIFETHIPAKQYEFAIDKTDAKGNYIESSYGGTHLIKFATEADRNLFHTRVQFARKVLKKLSRKSIKELENIAEDKEWKYQPCYGHTLFMEIAPHTWHTLYWNGATDHEDATNLRNVINRVLEAIGPITEDTNNYIDYMERFYPDSDEAGEDILENKKTAVELGYDPHIAAQQLLIMLKPRKYAKKYLDMKLPPWWWNNPSKYNYAGIEIGHVKTLGEIAEAVSRGYLTFEELELPGITLKVTSEPNATTDNLDKQEKEEPQE